MSVAYYDLPSPTPNATDLLPRILDLQAQGKTHRQIGEELGINRRSVASAISRASGV